MQGYGTMANEAADQLRQLEVNRPTHVFVQAGVGSLASAMVGFFTNLFPSNPPKFVIMEAGAADCLYQGAVVADGDPRIVGGDLKTIMAGLACGEPNTIGWDILRNHADAFVSCPDWVSAKGMRMLAAPVKGDPAVTSGESGAVGMGVISTIMCDHAYAELPPSCATTPTPSSATPSSSVPTPRSCSSRPRATPIPSATARSSGTAHGRARRTSSPYGKHPLAPATPLSRRVASPLTSAHVAP